MKREACARSATGRRLREGECDQRKKPSFNTDDGLCSGRGETRTHDLTDVNRAL